MADRATLRIHLMFAKALSVSTLFDASAAFRLLQRISEGSSIPMEGHMREATEMSLLAAASREVHASAVARYALQRVIIELEGRLKARAS